MSDSRDREEDLWRSADIRARAKEHFQGRGPEDVVAAAERLMSFAAAPPGPRISRGQGDNVTSIVPVKSTRVPLRGYLASALSNLGESDRERVFRVSDVIAAACAEYELELYQPRTATDPVQHRNVVDVEVFHTDRQQVLKSDFIIHLCELPSTGAGMELAFAYQALLPIVLVHRSERSTSRMITGIPAVKFEITYEDLEDLGQDFRAFLSVVRPQLVERKLAFGDFDETVVATRVREIREKRGITRRELAEALGITVDAIASIEEESEKSSLLSLAQLRRLATCLHVSVAELVTADMDDLVIRSLGRILQTRFAARYHGATQRDKIKIQRHILLRLLASYEEDDT